MKRPARIAIKIIVALVAAALLAGLILVGIFVYELLTGPSLIT